MRTSGRTRTTSFAVAAVASVVLLSVGISITGGAAGAAGHGGGADASTRAAPDSRRSTPPLTFSATGFFRVAQADGRWWLVTPTGQPFYADGVDHVSASGDVDQTTGQCPYCQAIAADYPSTAAWGTATLARLRSWGFDSLGDYSDDSTLGAEMPFPVQLSMASGDDWFAPSFVTNADAVAAAEVPQYADNPNVIGYYTDSELDWGPPDTPGGETLLQEYLNLPAGSPGLAVAQEYVGDPAGFLYAIAQRYFSVTTAAIRMYDPNHLILGVKAEGQEIQPQLLEAAQGYVDVFSVEDYTLQPGFAQIVDSVWPYYLPVEPNLANMAADFDGPMMIGEYSFIAPGVDPNTVPGIYYVSANQQARATDYANFVAPLYEDAPWLVGDNWFEYVDEPAGGRVGDGENNDFGLVNVEDQPYTDLVDAASTMHSILPDRVGQSGSTCDSWAQGPDGVVCNATMSDTSYPVSIVAEPLLAATQGTAYSDTVYAGGGLPPYKFSLVAGHLPSGLTLDHETGVISGVPTKAETAAFTLGVRDKDRTTATQTESIAVAPDVPLTITTTGVHRALESTAYSQNLRAAGGTKPYTWTVTSGAPPTGITLDPDGQLAGVPTASGTFTFTVEATDSTAKPLSASATYDLVVKAESG